MVRLNISEDKCIICRNRVEVKLKQQRKPKRDSKNWNIQAAVIMSPVFALTFVCC